MSSLFLDTISGLFFGIIAGILPGVHPMLLPLHSPVTVGLTYGVFATLSILPVVWFMFVDPDNFASTNAVSALLKRGSKYVIHVYAWGALLSVPFLLLSFPLTLFFEWRPPTMIVFVYLILISLLLLLKSRRKIRTVFLAALASLLGIVALRFPIAVRFPLVPLVAGLFGMSDVLLASPQRGEGEERFHPNISFFGPVVAGVLAGLFVSFFPALSISLALLLFPFFSGPEGFIGALGSATVSAYFFSIFGRRTGFIRTALAAALPENVNPFLVSSALFAGVSLGVLLIPLLSKIRVDRRLAPLVIVVCVFLVSGALGLFLLLASTALGVLARFLGVEKRVLTFSIIAPTLVFYAA